MSDAPRSSHIAHGTPDALREFVRECLQMTAFYAGRGVDYAAAGDDAGLRYSTRCATAAMRQALSVMKMLENSQ